MKEKSNVIWLYTIIMFSAAILLILISSLSQLRLSPSEVVAQENEQQVFNQTIQNRVTDLVSENEKLRGELKDFSNIILQLEENSVIINSEMRDSRAAAEATDFLIQAEMLFNTGRNEESFAMLQNINAFALNDNAKQLYDWLSEKLAKKGFVLE